MFRVKTPHLGIFGLTVLVFTVAALFAGAISISPIQKFSTAHSSVACPDGWTSVSAEICELKVLSDTSVSLPELISTDEVLLVGGGGGGGGAGGNPNGGNAGGGGGGEVKYLANQNMTGELSVDIGAGGTGGPRVSSSDTGVSTPLTPGLDGLPTVLSGALTSTANGGGGGQQGAFSLGDTRPLSELENLLFGRGGDSGNENSGGLAGWNLDFGQVEVKGSATEFGGGGAGDGENAPVSTSSSNGGAGSLPNLGLFAANTDLYGGGGGAGGNLSRLGGSGGGGKGGIYNESAIAGSANTGGGGGGAGGSRNSSFFNNGGIGANGGSGIVVLRFEIPDPPGNPISPSASAGDGTATVSWTAPAPLTAPMNYTVTASPNSPAGLTCSVDNLTAVCSPLTNGTEYTFTISAINYSGNSSASVTATPVAPSRPDPRPSVPPTPGPPPLPSEDDFNFDGEDGKINVEVDPPKSSAELPDSYKVIVRPSGKSCFITLPAQSCSIDGLKNRTPYKVKIRAINGYGSNSITLGRKYMFISGKLLGQTSKLTVSGFAGASSEVSSSTDKAVLGFFNRNKSATAFTCAGYAAGKKTNPSSKPIALERANNICEIIKAEKPSAVAIKSGRVPGSPEIPKNRKVIITAFAQVF